MFLSSLALRTSFSVVLLFAAIFSSPLTLPRADVNTSPDSQTAALTCATGFKPGKTPVSLKVGAPVGCYNVALAASAKKLLTTDTSKSCFACHSTGGVAPVSKMNAKLRKQGYTLKPTSITAAFKAHASQMMGAKLTSSQAKAISNFLQSIK